MSTVISTPFGSRTVGTTARSGQAKALARDQPAQEGVGDELPVPAPTMPEELPRLYIHRFSDKDGNPMDPVKQGLSPDIPKEMRHEVIFRELGKDRTEVRVIEYGWPVCPMMEMSKRGLEQCLDKMAALLGK